MIPENRRQARARDRAADADRERTRTFEQAAVLIVATLALVGFLMM